MKVFNYGRPFFRGKKNKTSESAQQRHPSSNEIYNQWLKCHLPTESQCKQLRTEIETFKVKPLFSVIMPVYNPEPIHFRRAIESVQAQVYENWELCIADDNSSTQEVRRIVTEYQNLDERIKVVYRSENGQIAAASNTALELATGEFVVLMDQDDLLTIDALFHNARMINQYEKIDLIYSDEDKVDDNGYHLCPHFKPDWCPDNLLSRNYLGHLTVLRTNTLRSIGGWRLGYDGSQDYELMLRFVEVARGIHHIPRILYHWRAHENSVAALEHAKPYAYLAAQKALTETLTRRGEPGSVEIVEGFRGYSIRYQLIDPEQKVSIIIPTRDKADYLKRCIDSIFEKSTYGNFEVVVVDNNSVSKELSDLITLYTEEYPNQFSCVRAGDVFNFSLLVNLGAKKANGKYIVFLNNDTTIITPDWLEGMMEQAQRPATGVVGAKLLYEDGTIQHAGVVLGLGGVAGHAFVGEQRFGPGYFNYINLTNNYSALTAACIMIRKNIYEEVGGFDEQFSVEYNDVDFCLKVRQAGYHNIYVPHVELVHYESISRGHPHANKESYERHLREADALKTKWKSYVAHDPCYNPNLTRHRSDFSLRQSSMSPSNDDSSDKSSESSNTVER